MKMITQEWVDKAEADFVTAKRMRGSRTKFMRDVICFHLQQCVEKYFKARLIEAEISFPKTHDLEKLLDMLLQIEPLWESLRPILGGLTDAAVEVRYPGRTISPLKTRMLFEDATTLRKIARTSLGLP